MKARALILAVVALLQGACDECAGTPSCHSTPEVSATGQFIDRLTGSTIGNVAVAFVRSGGIEITGDTVRATSDDDGHFTLRTGAFEPGTVTGQLIVTPPSPFQRYTMPLELTSSTVRGEGAVLGRIVVNPYLLLIGLVRDGQTEARIPDATVEFRRIGGGRVEPETATFTTDFGGQFKFEPTIIEPGTVIAEFRVTAPGYPPGLVFQAELELLFRDGEYVFRIFPVNVGG